jgi:hypothetical protein
MPLATRHAAREARAAHGRTVALPQSKNGRPRPAWPRTAVPVPWSTSESRYRFFLTAPCPEVAT